MYIVDLRNGYSSWSSVSIFSNLEWKIIMLTNIFTIFVSLIFLFSGIMLIRSKNINLISGLNDRNTVDLPKHVKDRICELTGLLLLFNGLNLMVGSLLSLVYAQVNEYMYIYTGIVLIISTIIVIFLQKNIIKKVTKWLLCGKW